MCIEITDNKSGFIQIFHNYVAKYDISKWVRVGYTLVVFKLQKLPQIYVEIPPLFNLFCYFSVDINTYLYTYRNPLHRQTTEIARDGLHEEQGRNPVPWRCQNQSG